MAAMSDGTLPCDAYIGYGFYQAQCYKGSKAADDKDYPGSSPSAAVYSMDFKEEYTLGATILKASLGSAVSSKAVRKGDKAGAVVTTLPAAGGGGFEKVDRSTAAKMLGVKNTELKDSDGMPAELLVPVVGVYHTPAELAVVSEDWTAAKKQSYLAVATKECYSEFDVQQTLSRVIEALKALHSMDVVHGNLQITDLVVSDLEGLSDVMITNYGLAQLTGSGHGILAPECLDGKAPTKKTDIWGLGCILYQLLVGYAPFSLAADTAESIKDVAEYDKGIKDKIKAGDVPFADLYWKSVSEDAKDMVEMLMVCDPAKRRSWDEIEDHPFMTGRTLSNSDMPEAKRQFEVLAAKAQ